MLDFFKKEEYDSAFAFADKLLELQDRIEDLERANSEKDTALFELENRLLYEIDRIHPVQYNIVAKEDIDA
jgi:predicted transcriptional regulator